ncbi:MAG: family 1 glycosylhydrolase, partial [Thermoplasmata archaeon]
MKFPKDFLWGTAISAFQTEMGSSDESISKKSDWYVWVHDKNNIDEGVVSGDFPDDGDGFWDLYKEDVKNAK